MQRHLRDTCYIHTRLYIHISFVVVSYQCLEWITQRPRSECLCFLCLSFLFNRLFNSTCLRISFSHSFLQVPVCLSQKPVLTNRQLRLPNKTSKNTNKKQTKKTSPKHIFRHFEFLKNIMYYSFAQSNPSTYTPISMA